MLRSQLARRVHISRPLILIADGWLANAGDAAILLAMRRSLTRAIPGARLVFCCHQHRLVGDRYGELELAPPLESLIPGSSPWIDERDLEERESLERLVSDADLVIAPGGGFLYEHYGPHHRLASYEWLLERGARLVFYSQSFGEFRNAKLRDRLAAILRASALVLVRDLSSYETAQAWGGIRNLELTADEAFLLTAPRRLVRRRGALLATVSTHPWFLGAEGALPIGDEQIRALAGSLTRLLARRTFEHVTLVSTTQGLGGARWALEDDLIAARQVVAHMRDEVASRVTVVPGYISTGDYIRLAARHSAVLSMRMHGAILAAVAGTPTLLANAAAKVRWLSQKGEPVFETSRSSADLGRLDELLAELLARRRSWMRDQSRAVAGLRRLAARNARLVAETL
jgi:polysaccharide pyruvyl transferase WcaK-like protein